ncbi:MAG: hypothetical protein P4M11_13930, partial [Candidatus Pacebacteria bacterium]|nr:hypothetical protein [Candidatus Paceibacterota bacterium]
KTPKPQNPKTPKPHANTDDTENGTHLNRRNCAGPKIKFNVETEERINDVQTADLGVEREQVQGQLLVCP